MLRFPYNVFGGTKLTNNETFEFHVGERIRFFREKKHITTNKLANLAGISQSYLRDVELENKNPTIEIIYQICKALGITLKEFFDDDNKEFWDENNLDSQIYCLNQEQKEALSIFLKTMLH